MYRLLLVFTVYAAAIPLVRSFEGISYAAAGSFRVANPAFFTVAPFQLDLPTPTDSLFISSFSAGLFTPGSVYIVENITSHWGAFDKVTPVAFNFSFVWPNALQGLPSDVLSQLQLASGVLVPDGFLAPLKNNGGLYVIGQSEPGQPPVKYSITNATLESGYFYHTGVWVDMNADGRLDLLSAHASLPLFGKPSGALVWYEQPPDGLASLPWKESIITSGPDFFFTALELDNDQSTIEVIAAEFFGKQLSLSIISVTAENPGELQFYRVLDDTVGAAEKVDIALLSGKGSEPELLVNNHQDAATNGIFAYTIPSDIRSGDFVRRTLASHFPVTEGGISPASPGFVYAVDPYVPPSGSPPYILVAGDGAQSAYLLSPQPVAPPTYLQQTIINTTGTVGSILVTDDWNNDGLREFLVPDYDHGVVYAYTFTQSTLSSIE